MRALRCTTGRSPKPRLTHPNQLGGRGGPLGRVLAGFVLASLSLCVFPGNAQAQTATLSIDSPSVDEGNSNTVLLTYTVSLDPASGQTVTVAYADAGTGTATAGTDYTTITGATLTFAPDTTTQTFAVTVTGDALDEPNETIEVTLSNPSNAVLDGGGTTLTGTGTIIDDDPGFCDRTLQVRTEILAAIPNVNNCYNVTTTHLAGITGHLNLRAQGITSLQAGDFAGLSRLTNLSFGGNLLSSLPVGVFAGLSRLTNLSFGGNLLSSLPVGVFAGLSRLTNLSFGGNLLSSLPVGVFAGLSRLTNLSFAGNLLSSLPPGVFAGLSSLTSLSLDTNRLSSLPTGVFAGLSSLWELSLGSNRLSSLPTGVFAGLSSLRNLLLQNNRLSSLPAGVFTGLTNLAVLWLFGNPGTPFTFTMEPERSGPNTFVVKVREGAPFAMTTNLSVSGGELPTGVTSVTVATGSTTSDPITVTPTGTDPVVVTLGRPPRVPGSLTETFFFLDFIKTAVGRPLTLSKALTVSFESATYTATEGGTAATVTVQLDQATDRPLTISIGVTGGTAATTDYSVSPTSVSFAAGDRTKTLTVTAADDADLADETVVLGFGSLPPDVTEGTLATTTVTLVDDDQAGLTVSFEASAYSTIEGAATGVTVRVSLNKAPAEEQTISIEVTGGTAATTDYSVSPTSVSFAAGDRTKTLTVTATDDADLADETVVLGFGALPPDVTEGTLATTTVTLVDDDRTELKVSFVADAYTATENGADATVTVTLDQAADRPLEIPLKVTGGTAGTTDYGVTIGNPPNWDQTTQTGMLSFGKGDSSQTFTVEASNDTLVEVNETVRLDFGAPLPDGVTAGTVSRTTVTLVDDDRTELKVRFGADAYTATENGTAATVTVTLDQDSDRDLTISIEVTGGTAATTDYSVSPTSVSFAAGDRTKTLTVTATDDALAEVNETVVLGFGTLPPDVTEGTLATTTVTLVDDDRTELKVSFVADAYTATENGADATVTVTLDQAADRPLEIPLKVTGGTAGTTDYGVTIGNPPNWNQTTQTGMLSFGKGDSSQTFTVEASNDTLVEVNETVRLDFGLLPADVTAGTLDTTTVTLVDDDRLALTLTVAFGAAAYTATEGEADGVTVTVSLDQAANRPLTIPLKTDPASGDFTLSVTEVGFTVGEQSQTFTVTATDDADLDDETVMLRFGDLTRSAVTEGKPAEAMLTITDDDGAAIRARFRRLNDEILSKQALTLADVTIAAVTSRMDAGACAGQPTTVSLGGSSTLAEILTANAQTLTTGRLNLKQFLGTSSFRLRLTEDGSGAGPGCLTLWGQGDYRNLSSGDSQALDWDGDLLTGQVGADALLRPDLLAGLAVSWSDGDFDYTDRTTGEPFSGDSTSRMMSVHPYVTWWSPMGLDLWATGGYGQGEIEIEDEEVGTHTSDTTLRLGSVGASGPLPIGDALIAGGTTTLRVKAQASLAQMEVAGHGSLLQEQTIAAQRLRLALEGSHKRTLASGAQLAPSLEVGLRHDGGDGITGTGLELGGGLRYVDPALGLTLEGRGRVLAAYDDAYKEWGASGLIRLDPGAAGQGLSLSLAPSYGQTASGVQRLWDQGLPQGPTQGPSPTQALTGRLEAEVGYGLTAFAGQGLVTPYGRLSLGGGTQQYRVGSRLELGPALRLSLEGTRQVTAVGQADHGIRLQVGWRF